MKGDVNLIDFVGYEFFQITFTVAVCFIPYMFFKYTLVILLGYVIWRVLYRIWSAFLEQTIDISGRGVFITGCDSGFGFAFAKHFDELGFIVFAGCLNEKGDGARKLRSDCSKRLHIVEIDVTKERSISSAFAYIKKHIPRNGLWGIVNNAGVNFFGEVELTTVSLYERTFNINLYGPIRVMREFLPLIRQSQGRVVNITSVHGRMTLPGQSNYETAKHGVETLSDSLRLEMKKFGVKVSIVEPGMYGRCTSVHNTAVVKRQTREIDEMWENASQQVRKVYSKEYLMSWLPKPTGTWPPSDDVTPVVSAVEHALVSASPKSRYLVDGVGSKLSFIDEYATLARFNNILPTWIIVKCVAAWRNCYKRIK
ncbi:D-beta-hydroxybutyrate dehydrogenase, mitochondrial-like [Mercenaria mercenaria]|uniref:D-beta-hydroxybutyrate dehydrogenase, mitochondrial-like n=1 Tax=Mercenaria mercenaria TaxID=6596 RepID=UPI00234E7BA1|nr:D-beta-hydroxybutyrate dehydrogenase, mitochondrial-like [Mercenaria mercenaria]